MGVTVFIKNYYIYAMDTSFLQQAFLKKKKHLIYSALELMTQVYIIFLKILSVVQCAVEW